MYIVCSRVNTVHSNHVHMAGYSQGVACIYTFLYVHIVPTLKEASHRLERPLHREYM